jgi:hypothetical protein
MHSFQFVPLLCNGDFISLFASSEVLACAHAAVAVTLHTTMLVAAFLVGLAAAEPPVFTENITVYHVYPGNFGLAPVNMVTSTYQTAHACSVALPCVVSRRVQAKPLHGRGAFEHARTLSM